MSKPLITHAAGGRAMCYRCFKVAVACVCGDVPLVKHRTGVIVLQHPRERHHPFGTARFVRLGLAKAALRMCAPNDRAAMARATVFPPKTAFLYPTPGARDVADLRPDERPDHIVVVDATWHHAKAIVKAAPALAELPCLRLDLAQPSIYRVRREPRHECLSTIEAVVETLRILEPETVGLDRLLVAFERMIDRQVAVSPCLPQPKRRRNG